MRRTKIEHTLQKKEQNGYTDLDDFGTVPLPEGYYVAFTMVAMNESMME